MPTKPSFETSLLYRAATSRGADLPPQRSPHLVDPHWPSSSRTRICILSAHFPPAVARMSLCVTWRKKCGHW